MDIVREETLSKLHRAAASPTVRRAEMTRDFGASQREARSHRGKVLQHMRARSGHGLI